MGDLPVQTYKQGFLNRDPEQSKEFATKAYVDRAIDAIALVLTVGRLAMPMTATDTIATLENAKPVQAGTTLKIDDELMSVDDAADGSNLAVTRAVSGSTAAAHTIGTLVLPVVIAG